MEPDESDRFRWARRSLIYLGGKLAEASSELDKEDLSLERRLVLALNYVTMAPPQEFPVDLQRHFGRIWEVIGPDMRAKVKAMSEAEQSTLAELIKSLSREVNTRTDKMLNIERGQEEEEGGD